jgi:SAM-dependent methyltransferase
VAQGTVEYLAGYSWPIYDCAACRCRFTRHDGKVYSLLHQSGAISYYADYRRLGAECQEMFERRDCEGLRQVLCRTAKYRFVIERAMRESSATRLLEVGCSHGYLTSYFIIEGKDVLGIDVSHEAVAAARAAFGDHFQVADPAAVRASSGYDVIYHVGVIGCVADPVGLTTELLGMLRPGGKLLFNAPNRGGLHLNGQLWLDSAPPPDLVTLFPETFWKRRFSDVASVVERAEMLPSDAALAINLRRYFWRRWANPVSKPLAETHNAGHAWSQPAGTSWRLFERAARKAARVTGLARLAPSRPSDFGIFVEMTV